MSVPWNSLNLEARASSSSLNSLSSVWGQLTSIGQKPSITVLWQFLFNNALYHSYLSTACRIWVIQVFLSSLEVVWISYISGSLEDAQIRNMALSACATSLTISFWREMTDGLLSYGGKHKTQEWIRLQWSFTSISSKVFTMVTTEKNATNMLNWYCEGN